MLDRLTLTNLKELQTRTGVAFTATLRLDGEAIATVENKGDGGCNTYYATGKETAAIRLNNTKVRELEKAAAAAIGRQYEALDFLLCFMNSPTVTADQVVAAAKAEL